MIKNYCISDAKLFDFRDKFEIKSILSVEPTYLETLSEMSQGNVYTIWHENVPVSICGWTVSIYGNACLFMSASSELKNRFCKEIMHDFWRIAITPMERFKRTECIIAEDNINKRFVEFLGFHKESKLENYNFDGSDMYMYVYLNKGTRNE